MSKPDYAATAILTEHFGFAPIAVIDDVINAVNEIMYKCTSAMETYLLDRQEKRKHELSSRKNLDEDVLMEDGDDSNNLEDLDPYSTKDEIQLGTGKLETLLETEISKNFDKFELYCLRNLFSIPSELVENGMFRLRHHEGIDFSAPSKHTSSVALDSQIESLLKEIQFELQLRKIMKLQIAKAKKLVKLLRQYKGIFQFLKTPGNRATSDLLQSLSPLDENLFYVLEQGNELITQVQNIQYKINNKLTSGGIKDLKLHPTARAKYLKGKSYKLLESIGVLETENRDELLEIITGDAFLGSEPTVPEPTVPDFESEGGAAEAAGSEDVLDLAGSEPVKDNNSAPVGDEVLVANEEEVEIVELTGISVPSQKDESEIAADTADAIDIVMVESQEEIVPHESDL